MSWNDFVVLKNSLSFPLLCYLNSLLWNLSAGNIFMSECCIFCQSIGPLPGQRVSCLSNCSWRDICSQKSLSVYTWQDRNDSVYLCALQVQPLLAGVRKHYLPSQSAHRSSAQSYHSLSGTVCGCSLFFCFCTQHTYWSDSGVLHSLCVHVCVWICVNRLCCKTLGEELYLCYDFVKHWTHEELSGVLLLCWCNKPLFWTGKNSNSIKLS